MDTLVYNYTFTNKPDKMTIASQYQSNEYSGTCTAQNIFKCFSIFLTSQNSQVPFNIFQSNSTEMCDIM